MKVFSSEEVYRSCLEYFNGDELAATTWMNKYAMKNQEQQFVECTPDDMHKRLASAFAEIEKTYISTTGKDLLSDYGKSRPYLDEDKIYRLLKDFRYIIPQGSVMAACNNPFMIASLSNCVVMPELYDSYGGIFHTDQQLAQLFKRRCGVGIDLSALRPAGMSVSNAARTTSGAVTFMERFSNTTREVAQNGRRGALMMTMDIAHPDIEQFITIKQDLQKITGANISVRISDEFMKAVESDRQFRLHWPLNAENPAQIKMVNAKSLWNSIVTCAHRTAEPGIVFWDKQHHYSTSSIYPEFKNVSTNPCSEIAMQGGDSCRLIALNLFSFVEEPFTDHASFDFRKFYETTYEAQRMMDNLVDLELLAIDRILQKVESDPEPLYIKQVELDTWHLLRKEGAKGRRTGLGFTALADALAALLLTFDSDDALMMTEEIMKTKCRAEFDSSIDMAIERGAFTGFDREIERTSHFVNMLEKEFPDIYKRMMLHGRRNVSISTVAPTGTLSILARTSAGIEPVYMLSYTRRRKVNAALPGVQVDFTDASGDAWEEFSVDHYGLKKWMEITGEKDVTRSPYINSTASSINWKKRIALQAVVQKYTTHSISSTINLPADATADLIGNIYMEAWKSGLKGITVYRDGSRSGVLLAESNNIHADQLVPDRPDELDAEVIRFRNHDEKWIAVIGLLNEKPYEIFTGKEDASFRIPGSVDKGWIVRKIDPVKRYDFQYEENGKRINVEGLSRSFNAEYWNYAKLISGVLRFGMPLIQVIELISGLHLVPDSINTWKSGVERALRKFIPDGTFTGHRCPECSSPKGLIYEESCVKCRDCGYSECG